MSVSSLRDEDVVLGLRCVWFFVFCFLFFVFCFLFFVFCFLFFVFCFLFFFFCFLFFVFCFLFLVFFFLLCASQLSASQPERVPASASQVVCVLLYVLSASQ